MADQLDMSTKSLQAEQRLGSSSSSEHEFEPKHQQSDLDKPEQAHDNDEENVEYPPPGRAAIVMVALLLAMFLTALVSPSNR